MTGCYCMSQVVNDCWESSFCAAKSQSEEGYTQLCGKGTLLSLKDPSNIRLNEFEGLTVVCIIIR
jgi:hypothetical protein